MGRSRGIALFLGGALTATLLTGVASAASTDPCDSLYTGNTISALHKYEACRFDRIDKKLDQLQPAPTPTPAPTTQPPSPSPTDTPPPPSPSPTDTPTSPTPVPTPTSGVCKPGSEVLKFTGQGSAGMGQYEAGADSYDASAEEWGVTGYNYAQTMGVCSHRSWYVDVTTDNTKGDGAVKAYPSMRKMYRNWSVPATDPAAYPNMSTFQKMTIDYAATSPGDCSGCIYDTAFDLWFNKSADNSSIEVMVWTQNNKQTPSGKVVASGVKFGGHIWDVWANSDNTGISYVPTDVPTVPSGTLDVKALVADLASRNQIEADPKVSQLSFGVETVSTGAVSQHWDFTDFNVNDGR